MVAFIETDGLNIAETLVVVTLATKTLRVGATRAFEVTRFPDTYRVVPEAAVVLRPTKPEGPKITEAFVVVVLALTTLMFGAVRAFDAYRLPRTYRVVPEAAVVLIPTLPESVVTLVVVTLAVVATRFAPVMAFEAYKFPAIENKY